MFYLLVYCFYIYNELLLQSGHISFDIQYVMIMETTCRIVLRMEMCFWLEAVVDNFRIFNLIICASQAIYTLSLICPILAAEIGSEILKTFLFRNLFAETFIKAIFTKSLYKTKASELIEKGVIPLLFYPHDLKLKICEAVA